LVRGGNHLRTGRSDKELKGEESYKDLMHRALYARRNHSAKSAMPCNSGVGSLVL